MSSQETITKFVKDTGLGKLSFNETIIDVVMNSGFPDKLTIYPTEELTRACVAIAQYLCFLVNKRNKDKVVYMEHKNIFDSLKRASVLKYDIKARSNEEVLARVFDKEPRLKDMNDNLVDYDSTCQLSENVAEYMKELINAIKRELDRRQYEFTNYNRLNNNAR